MFMSGLEKPIKLWHLVVSLFIGVLTVFGASAKAGGAWVNIQDRVAVQEEKSAILESRYEAVDAKFEALSEQLHATQLSSEQLKASLDRLLDHWNK